MSKDDIEVNAAFYATRRALKHMVPRGRGRIVNISSVEGKQANKPAVSNCITTKHALMRESGPDAAAAAGITGALLNVDDGKRVVVTGSPRELQWPDLVWSHFSRPRFGDFDARVSAAASAGFAGIGLFAPEYERLRDEEGRTAKDIGRQLDDHGLVLAEVETVHGWASSGDAAAECRRREELAYELADELGVRHLQAIGPHDGTVGEAGAAFGRLCDRAAAHGLLVGVEWLPYTNIATAVDAQAIVEAADRPNGGYCADIWHHRRGADDDAMLEALPGDRVFAVQMNDGPRQPQLDDYKADCLANRVPPGEGELDCVGFVRLLQAIGVRSPISLEVCSTELWAAPAREAATRAADGMRAVLAAAAT